MRMAKLLGVYRKNHIPLNTIFYEKLYFKPGNLGYPVFNTRYGKIGLLICHDRHYPEGARALALNGAEILLVPSATPDKSLSRKVWEKELRGHAIFNEYFVCGSQPHRPRRQILLLRSQRRIRPCGRNAGPGRRWRGNLPRRLRSRSRHSTSARLAIFPGQAPRYLWHSHRAGAVEPTTRNNAVRPGMEITMRKLTLIAMLLSAFGLATQVQAADKVRFAYAVQVHQANMMIIQDLRQEIRC